MAQWPPLPLSDRRSTRAIRTVTTIRPPKVRSRTPGREAQNAVDEVVKRVRVPGGAERRLASGCRSTPGRLAKQSGGRGPDTGVEPSFESARRRVSRVRSWNPRRTGDMACTKPTSAGYWTLVYWVAKKKPKPTTARRAPRWARLAEQTDGGAGPPKNGVAVKKILELVLCILHPIAVVLIWINLLSRSDLGLIAKLAWALAAIVPFVPFVYVLTGNDFI